jgi:hypothetical protein
MLRCLLAGALLLTMGIQRNVAAPFEHVGKYHAVKSSTGEHCSGYSLELWKLNGRLIALLDVHRGLCGDPPCGAIADAALEAKTGRLTFSTMIRGERWTFAGRLTKQTVTGTLNGERVRLARDTDRDKYWTDHKPDQSVAAWCEFWSGVTRCAGVREVCGSLGKL